MPAGGSMGRELYRRGHLDWQRDLSWTDGRGVGYLLLPPERFAAAAPGRLDLSAPRVLASCSTRSRPGAATTYHHGTRGSGISASLGLFAQDEIEYRIVGRVVGAPFAVLVAEELF